VPEAFLARSLLYTPATRSDRFQKAVSSGADIVAVDLEDSVAPGDKMAARQNALAWLAAPCAGGAARALRINGTRTLHGLRDILAIVEARAKPELILLPKVEAAADIEQLDALLQGPLDGVRFVALIESAKAFARLDEIARSTPRLLAFQLGSADLSADLRAANSWESLLYARSQLVRAAAAAGIEVIDTPYFNLSDTAALEAEARAVLRLGFTGKAAVHPKQIAAINTAFSPTAAEIEQARAVLAENEKGVGLVDGQMIDEAIARRARRVLALAEAQGGPAEGRDG
jgi:(S)-citramalyl-CoA lyase